MEYITGIFNNRELAILTWLIILFIWALTNKHFRQVLLVILKFFSSLQILIPLAFMGAYIWGMIYLFSEVRLWNISNLKDTIVWILGSAFVMFVNVNDVKDNKYFTKILNDNLKAILIVEFIVNAYTFGFWSEFILIPCIVVLSLSLSVAERDKKYGILKDFLQKLMSFIGLVFVVYSFYKAFTNLSDFATVGHLTEFLLPPVFTIAFLPFMYIASLYAIYQYTFIRLSIFKNEKKLIRYAKLRIFTRFHFNHAKLRKWSERVGALKFSNKEDIEDLLNK
ncbi:MAG: hypothetical protein U0V18_11530 [Anaerolineales bacterium]